MGFPSLIVVVMALGAHFAMIAVWWVSWCTPVTHPQTASPLLPSAMFYWKYAVKKKKKNTVANKMLE